MDRKLMAMPIGLGMLIIGHLSLPAHALPHRKAASATTAPKITITKMPMDPPSEEMASSEIEGTVTAPPANSHVVVYALGGGTYYVQPSADQTVIKISKGHWASETHGGEAFVALLVKDSYIPDATRANILKVGGPILAIARRAPR